MDGINIHPSTARYAAGGIGVQTSILLPLEQKKKAKEFNINISKLLREALAAEIARIEREQNGVEAL